MKKKLLICLFIILGITVLALVTPFIILGIRSNKINNDYKYLLLEDKLEVVKIEDVPLIKQDISCGYAIIDMLSSFYGARVSEEELYNNNSGRITTSSTAGFVEEASKVLNKKCYAKKYLKNDELLLAINHSLASGNPVAIEWAAKLDGSWTLHWSVITGMDKELIYVNNPYGYKEELTYDEFTSRTTFKAFDHMPIGYQFGFAFGLFTKNTIIVIE